MGLPSPRFPPLLKAVGGGGSSRIIFQGFEKYRFFALEIDFRNFSSWPFISFWESQQRLSEGRRRVSDDLRSDFWGHPQPVSGGDLKGLWNNRNKVLERVSRVRTSGFMCIYDGFSGFQSCTLQTSDWLPLRISGKGLSTLRWLQILGGLQQ